MVGSKPRLRSRSEGTGEAARQGPRGRGGAAKRSRPSSSIFALLLMSWPVSCARASGRHRRRSCAVGDRRTRGSAASRAGGGRARAPWGVGADAFDCAVHSDSLGAAGARAVDTDRRASRTATGGAVCGVSLCARVAAGRRGGQQPSRRALRGAPATPHRPQRTRPTDVDGPSAVGRPLSRASSVLRRALRFGGSAASLQRQNRTAS